MTWWKRWQQSRKPNENLLESLQKMLKVNLKQKKYYWLFYNADSPLCGWLSRKYLKYDFISGLTGFACVTKIHYGCSCVIKLCLLMGKCWRRAEPPSQLGCLVFRYSFVTPLLTDAHGESFQVSREESCVSFTGKLKRSFFWSLQPDMSVSSP